MSFKVRILLFAIISFFLGMFNPVFAQDAASMGLVHTLDTRHLEIHAAKKESLMKVGSYLEWFILYLDKNWYSVPSSMKIRVFVFSTESEFNYYARKILKADQELMGMYKDGCFYTSSETGLGTLSHEFMHAVFHYTNAKLDPWAHEGLPAFFEKMYGYCEKGQVYFITGFQNPWRIKALGQNLKNLSLEEIVNSSKNQNELRLVSVFLYKKGYLKRFLDISRTGNKGNFNTCFEAAFGRDIRSLEPVWKEYLKDIVAKHSLINQIPGSQFFSSKAKFDSFMQDNGEVLRGLM